MASYNKFNIFVENLCKKIMDFTPSTGDAFKVFLTNTAPVATNAVYGDISANDLSTANGYTAGGAAATIGTAAQTSGTMKVVVSNDPVWTASGGTIGPFRYIVFYDTTPTTPLKPLISWWDYGSSLTLNDTESFTADFDQTNGVFTVA